MVLQFRRIIASIDNGTNLVIKPPASQFPGFSVAIRLNTQGLQITINKQHQVVGIKHWVG